MSILPNVFQKENDVVINFSNKDGNVIDRIDENKIYIGIYFEGVLLVDGEEMDGKIFNLYYRNSTLFVYDSEQDITHICNESLSFETENNIFITTILNKQ